MDGPGTGLQFQPLGCRAQCLGADAEADVELVALGELLDSIEDLVGPGSQSLATGKAAVGEAVALAGGQAQQVGFPLVPGAADSGAALHDHGGEAELAGGTSYTQATGAGTHHHQVGRFAHVVPPSSR